MKDVDEWEWKVDKNEMTCSNDDYNVVVKMQKEGEELKGKLQDMPMELFSEISELKNGEKKIEKIVTNAEKAFYIICEQSDSLSSVPYEGNSGK